MAEFQPSWMGPENAIVGLIFRPSLNLAGPIELLEPCVFQNFDLFDDLISNNPSSLLKCGALILNHLTSRPVTHSLTTSA